MLDGPAPQAVKVLLTASERQTPRPALALVPERALDAPSLSPGPPAVGRVAKLGRRLTGREQPPRVPGVERLAQLGDAERDRHGCVVGQGGERVEEGHGTLTRGMIRVVDSG